MACLTKTHTVRGLGSSFADLVGLLATLRTPNVDPQPKSESWKLVYQKKYENLESLVPNLSLHHGLPARELIEELKSKEGNNLVVIYI